MCSFAFLSRLSIITERVIDSCLCVSGQQMLVTLAVRHLLSVINSCIGRWMDWCMCRPNAHLLTPARHFLGYDFPSHPNHSFTHSFIRSISFYSSTVIFALFYFLPSGYYSSSLFTFSCFGNFPSRAQCYFLLFSSEYRYVLIHFTDFFLCTSGDTRGNKQDNNLRVGCV